MSAEEKDHLEETLRAECRNLEEGGRCTRRRGKDILLEEGSSGQFQCQLCVKAFKTKRALQNHDNIHREKFKCETCGKCLGSRQQLMAHMNVHGIQQNRDHKCHLCVAAFCSAQSMRYHVKVCHPLEYAAESENRAKVVDVVRVKCETCSCEFNSKQALHYHNNIHLEKFKCQVCGKCFGVQQKLIAHMNLRHEPRQRTSNLQEIEIGQFQCHICDKVFRSFAALTYHKNIHLEKYKCETCEKCFGFGRRLRMHMQEVHASQRIRDHKCQLCISKFYDAKSLCYHMKLCHPIACANESKKQTKTNSIVSLQFKCDGCDKVFATDIAAKNHMYIHLRRFRCHQCGKCFESLTLLNRHEQVHVRNEQVHLRNEQVHVRKKYLCGRCQSMYRSEKELKNHLKNCKDDRPIFECSVCSKCFTSKKRLVNHMNVHAELFKCNVCDERCSTQSLLDQHIRLVHASAKRHLGRLQRSRCPSVFRRKKDLKIQTQECERVQEQTSFDPAFYLSDDVPEEITDQIRPRQFQCKICIRAFKSGTALRYHENVHLEKFKCKTCGKCFGIPQQLKAHLKVHSFRPRDHKCHLCFSKFFNVYILKTHLRLCHPLEYAVSQLNQGPVVVQLQFKCKGCDQLFATENGAYKHMNIHLQRFRCQECDKCFLSSTLLDRHRKIHSAKKYQCDQCKSLFRLNKELERHKKRCKQAGHLIECPVCSRSFAAKRSLVSHMNVHLELFKCTICDKCCNTQGLLDLHKQLVHSKNKRFSIFQCSQCLGVFRFHEALKIHAEDCKKIHQQPSRVESLPYPEGNLQTQNDINETEENPTAVDPNLVQKYKCNGCEKLFAEETDAKMHMFVHWQLFRCSQCQQCFESWATLKNHEQKMHSRNKYQCGRCKSIIPLLEELESHQRTCTGNGGSLQCSVCAKSFANRRNLAYHMNIHLEMFKCNVCDRCCSTKTKLDEHVQLHASGKPCNRFQCSQCFDMFRSHAALKLHAQECKRIEMQSPDENKSQSEETALNKTSVVNNAVDTLSHNLKSDAADLQVAHARVTRSKTKCNSSLQTIDQEACDTNVVNSAETEKKGKIKKK